MQSASVCGAGCISLLRCPDKTIRHAFLYQTLSTATQEDALGPPDLKYRLHTRIHKSVA